MQKAVTNLESVLLCLIEERNCKNAFIKRVNLQKCIKRENFKGENLYKVSKWNEIEYPTSVRKLLDK